MTEGILVACETVGIIKSRWTLDRRLDYLIGLQLTRSVTETLQAQVAIAGLEVIELINY